MLSRNLIIASVAVVFLATTASTAPVEDKEPEENDFEAEEGEEELSEEEEDDDDSKGQHLKGAGAQQATVVPKGPGVTALPGTSLVGQSPNGQKLNGDGAAQTSFGSSSGSSATADDTNGHNGRDSQALPSGSSSHDSSLSGQGGSTSGAVSTGAVISAVGHGSSKVPGTAGTTHSDTISHGSPSQVSLSHALPGQVSSSHVSSQMGSGQTSGSAFVSSEVQSQPAGSEAVAPHVDGSENGESRIVHEGSQIEAPGSESVGEMPETEKNGNGHKQLTNGLDNGHTGGLDHFMEGTTQIDLTGGFDAFGSSSHLEITGMIDQSSHDFLIGLMGGMGDSFAPHPYTDAIADHMGLAFQVESTAAGLDPGQPASSSSAPDTPPDPSGPDHSSAGTGPDSSVPSTGTSDNGAQFSSPGDMTGAAAAFEMMSHSDPTFTDYMEGADYNGNNDNNGADSPHTNGNGRHRPVVDIHRGDPPGTDIHIDTSSPNHQVVPTETQHTAGEQYGLATQTDTAGTLDIKDPTLSPFAKITDGAVTGAGTQTDVAGLAGEPVTIGHIPMDMTAMGDAVYSSSPPGTIGYDGRGVTEGISNNTADTVPEAGRGFADVSRSHNSVVQTEVPVTGGPAGASTQTDAMGTATSEPQGTLGGPSQLGATEQIQPAVSAGEQYHTSGQGPEGAENVELEDTC
ncbi:autotransporter adhesin BpaC isoform X3 [Pygocentrus nattereri]|uniref:autotransporter adhesin BpaC isoform X3 n=1 Tax=Pygocentrus nattereri TaxID=42514 RepID=UPI00081461F3|nr:autotransporter adhesin BpaC isoform X3 [Pygocentrus nattereri]